MEILLAAIRDLSDVNMLFKPGVLMISGVSWCHFTSLSFDKMMIFLNQNMIQSNPVSQKWCLFFTFFFFVALDHRSPSRRSRCCALRVFAVIRAAAWRSCVLGQVAKALRRFGVRFGHWNDCGLVESYQYYIISDHQVYTVRVYICVL